MLDYYIPDLEDDVSLPFSAKEALPDLSPSEELAMRSRTIKLVSDLTMQPIVADHMDEIQATALAKEMLENPSMRPDFASYSNETTAYLAGLVAQSNQMIVNDLAELKLYVVNKLVYEVEHAKTSKDRIAALKNLGEVDGVDAFKKRSEMTIQVKPIEEVEQELLSVLDNIEYTVVEYPPEVDDVGDAVENNIENDGATDSPDEV
jgi:hypothetical protein